MRRLAELVLHHRRIVIGFWIVMTVLGIVIAPLAVDRLTVSFDLPGQLAYEANKKILQTFGNGLRPALVATFTSKDGHVVDNPQVQSAIQTAAAVAPGSRVSSYFTTKSSAYVSKDGNTTFALIYRPGAGGFNADPQIDQMRTALQKAAPAGVTAHLTGSDAIQAASANGGGGPSLLAETIVGALGALIILLFVFGTVPAVLTPLIVAATSILTTFIALYALTFITDVSLIVQFLVALVGLGIAIDYSLLMIFRFREELRNGLDPHDAMIETSMHAGRAVIVSGSTVAVGLLALVFLPVPFIRSIGLGGLLIPIVSVLVTITLTPAILSLLGERINRYRVMPKRLLSPDDAESGFWKRWASLVMRKPWVVAAVGIVIVALLLVPAVQINASDAQAKDRPGIGDAIDGRNQLAASGISAGVLKPLLVVMKGPATTAQAQAVVDKIGSAPGMAGGGVSDNPQWVKGDVRVVEVFANTDASSQAAKTTIRRLTSSDLPNAQQQLAGVTLALGGDAAQEVDFLHAVYGNFPWVLAIVVLLTYILLARAFRSLVLPLKAVILNLVSLGAAFGIIVLVFQWGNGSKQLFDVAATQSIIFWIPLMIFAFLYGVSMDYEVFMLSRIREEYDQSGDTATAVTKGLAATGKLVTSASLILMFAFLVLAASPGLDIKQFGIGLAAGIVFDATIIRALLVPALMQLLKGWNWYLPDWAAKVLRVAPSQ